jgi:hypothetical protein
MPANDRSLQISGEHGHSYTDAALTGSTHLSERSAACRPCADNTRVGDATPGLQLTLVLLDEFWGTRLHDVGFADVHKVPHLQRAQEQTECVHNM